MLVVNDQNLKNAEANIESDLKITSVVFSRLIESRTESLRDIARPITSDHAFRQAFSVGDTATTESAMRNILSRLNGFRDTSMLLMDFDGNLLASSEGLFNTGSSSPWPWLLEQAEQDQRLESSGIVVFQDRLYQLIVAPLLIPDPEAWVVLGFPIDDGFANQISSIALTDLSVHSKNQNGDVQIHASSLSGDLKDDILTDEEHLLDLPGKMHRHYASQERYLSLNIELEKNPKHTIKLAIHGSFDKELAPYKRLNVVLLAILAIGLAFASLGTILLSRSITEPIKSLSKSVAEIGDGNFAARAKADREDEVGMLARAVNGMASGLQEKERVRNLLGRLVSNDVAEKLLKNDIELGGEEKNVSVLFSDIRDFTSLSETMPPSQLLILLNRYFTKITAIIESHNGVVDKYIGDEVMAIFGAPIESEDHAKQAATAAFEMLDALEEFNQEIREELGIELDIGIGINTGIAVAGNIGSQSRMNYTVVGDTVNTASRLEGLTKKFDVPIVVSEQTAAATPTIDWQDLGTANVKGKAKGIKVFTA